MGMIFILQKEVVGQIDFILHYPWDQRTISHYPWPKGVGTTHGDEKNDFDFGQKSKMVKKQK